MDNENPFPLNQNQEKPKNFWQRLKLWQKIGIIVFAFVIGAFSYYILIRPLLFPPTLYYSSVTEAPDTAFNAYLRAEEKCNIDLANSIITEKSKEIMHYTCSNMAAERQCHVNKTYKALTKGNTAIIHFDDFSHKTGWPFFFAKENGEWKIDFYKMANGITMGGSGCDTGWGWRNDEIKQEFCSYFKESQCPEEINASQTSGNILISTGKLEYTPDEKILVTIKNEAKKEIKYNTYKLNYLPDLELYGNKSGAWTRVPLLPSAPVRRDEVEKMIEENALFPEKSATIEYIPSSWSDKNFLDFASYKFSFKYAIENDEGAFEKYGHFEVYSNEFRIVKNTTSFQSSDISCNTSNDCVPRFSHCDCKFHCINKLVKIKDCSNVCNVLPESPVCYCVNNECTNIFIDRQTAIAYAQDHIRKNDIEVIDINNPHEVIEYDDYWYVSFDIKTEPDPLPPYRIFNVDKKTGTIEEQPRL